MIWLPAETRITRTVSAGSHFSWTVFSAGSKISRTVSEEAKYVGQSLKEKLSSDSCIVKVKHHRELELSKTG